MLLGLLNMKNHDMARAYADAGRLIPGSSAFNEQKEKFIHTAGLGGAGVSSDSKFYHVDGQYDFSNSVKFINLLLGGSYRNYDMETHGTLFDDKVDKVRVNEFGVFVQLSKEFLNHKLKLSTSGRYDKNENFDGNFTPRASIVFSPTEKHNFRASFQTGFRNPTVPDQFIKLNVGPIIILGGAPANSKGLNAYENSFTSSSVGAFASGFAADLNNGLSFPEAVAKNKDKLIKSNVPYIRPEESTSYELGYKSVIANGLLLDANYYYSRYTNFLINQVVIRTDNNVLTENGSVNISAAQDILNGKTQAFQLYTNAKDVVDAQGIGIGLSYQLPKKYRIATNLTWSSFNLRDANPNNIPAFNTPEWKTNLVFSNTRLTKNIGFSIAWHWQSAFDWYGTFTQNIPGQVKAYHLLDAQISYRIPEIKTTVKLAANNLTNQYITQAYGSPSVGGLYFVSLVFDELFK
jgi:iron complex outermembrane receptor protein